LQRLRDDERPALVAASDDADAKRKLALLDQRIAALEQSLQSAEVVPLAAAETGVVRFGATVTIRRADGEEDHYRIVGVDEIDLDRGWVSWLSPIARALLNASPRQRVRFRFPSGEEELEILKVEYEDV
jgi:transcription elongation factor GreB